MSFAAKVAKLRGWVLNPDTEFRDVLEKGLETNLETYGYYLCPCVDSRGDRARDREVTCPCPAAPLDLEEFGQCFCGLFLTPQRAQSGREAESIPDRRQ